MDFLERAIIPFKDRRFFPKAGVIFGLLLLGLFLSWAPQVIRYFLQMSSLSGPSEFYGMASLFGLLIQLMAALASFPLYVYQMGYQYDASNEIRKGKTKDVLPEHGSIQDRLKLGGVLVGINITITLPFIVVITIATVVILGTFLSLAVGGNSGLDFALFSGSMIILGLCIIVMVAIQSILSPAMMYIYLRQRKFASVFSFELVREVVAESWWKFLLVGFALNAISSLLIWSLIILGFLTCCLIPLLPFVQPLLQTAAYMLRIGVTGEIYRELDDVFKGTDLFKRE